MAIGRIVAAYPAVPFLTTTLVAVVTPDGTPAPALVAASLLGLLTALWFSALRAVGLPVLAAVPATLLLGLHPALLRAVVGGPADMFLALFIFLVGRGFYDLRARTETTQVMAVGTCLLGLAFSHPMGAAVAIAAMPFLGLTVRPALAATSPFSVVTALLFPTVFAAAAFVYVSWVFPGSGWSFYEAPAESLAAWSAGVARAFGDGLTGLLALDTTFAVLVALILGAPLAVMATYWARERRPLVAPPLVFAACIVTAAAVTVATRLFGAPTAVTVAAPALAAVVMTRVPPAAAREHLAKVLALLAAGWIGGAAGLFIIDPAISAPFRHDVDPNGDRERRDALAVGGATIDRDGVLVDILPHSRMLPSRVIVASFKCSPTIPSAEPALQGGDGLDRAVRPPARTAAGLSLSGPTLHPDSARERFSGCWECMAPNTMVCAISLRQIFSRRWRVRRSPSP